MPEQKNTITEELKSTLTELKNKGASTQQAIDELKTKMEKLSEEDGDLGKLKAAVAQLEEQKAAMETKLAGALEKITKGGKDIADNGGFESFGEFAMAVKSAQGGRMTEKMSKWHAKAPTTSANEGTGTEGGYLVPPQFASQIVELAFNDEALYSRTWNIPVSGNSMSIPVSEATPWGSTGVQANWVDEGGLIGQSRPRIETRTLRLNKLAVLVPATEELLEDASAIEAFIARGASQALRYKTDDAIMWGDGVGKPLGIFNSSSLVTVAKENAQTADTVVILNVANMLARLLPTSMGNAEWLVNPDVLPQLMTMTVGNTAVYMPGNSAAGSPYGTLLGRPLRPSVHCKTLGDKGDILLADFQQYMAMSKGIKVATSMHLWFDYDTSAFRFTFRVAGQPWLSAAVTPPNSASTLSPFVTLAERAGG